MRRIKNGELLFLEEMLYEALFVPEGQPPFGKSILEDPAIKKYISDWGNCDNDLAIVAEEDGQLTGVIWGRSFPFENKGYGFVNEKTPEISMAVIETHRNRGIGSSLLMALEKEYLKIGVEMLSLSVDKRNPASNLYSRKGYIAHQEYDTSITMIKKLTEKRKVRQ